jgi:sensor histidine kinase YesM
MRPWMIVSAAWIVPALLGAVDAVGQRIVWNEPLITPGALLFAGGDWLIYALFTPLVFALAAKWPIVRERRAGSIVVHLIASLLFSVAWAGLGTLLKVAVNPASFNTSVARFFASWTLTTLPFGVAVYWAMVGIEHAIRYFVEARDREMQLTRMSQQLSTAKLSALQAQLNPHFLFNSLNTVAVLVRDGKNAHATDVVEHLSDVLRRTLGRSRENEVTLDEELQLVRDYLAVESARFADRLRSTFDVDSALLSAAVPSFALQHLVENAVRHGIAQRSDAGTVAISARRDGDALELLVADDGAGLGDAPERAQLADHGLERTRERLRTLYGDRASLELRAAEPVGTIARLVIPYRELAIGAVVDERR